MILSHGRKYIFVHIPKTGGTSLALALEGRAMRDDIMLGDTPKALKRRKRLKGVTARGRLWKHATLADIDGLVTPEEMGAMLCFTLVRNPWDRMVSYYHWLRAQSFDHPVVGKAKTLEFDAFLRDPAVMASFANHPYASYLTDAQGRMRAGLFIRLEHFTADAEPLWDHLGFRLDLPESNRSARARDYRQYYDADSAAHVARLCAPDIAAHGYGFE